MRGMAYRISSELLSRQQIAAALALGGEVLSYWLKGGLLRAREGEGGGKGVHRRFGYEALHIGAILAEVSRYGANTGTLGILADLLWNAWTYGQQMDRYTETDVLDWVTLVRTRERLANDPGAFDTWLAGRTGHLAISPQAFELERDVDPVMELVFALYFDLFTREIDPDLDLIWMAAPTASDSFMLLPEATHFSALTEKLPSRIKLNVSRIIAIAWERLELFNQTDRVGAAMPTRPSPNDRGGHNG